MGYFIKNRQIGRKPTGPAIPVGTTADRPADPALATIRYNTDIGTYEFWNGTVYAPVGIQGHTTLTTDTFLGDGTTAAFTMSQPANDPEQILVFVGGVFQRPTTDYTVSATTLTFFTAPPAVSVSVTHGVGSTIVTSIAGAGGGPLPDPIDGGAYP